MIATKYTSILKRFAAFVVDLIICRIIVISQREANKLPSGACQESGQNSFHNHMFRGLSGGSFYRAQPGASRPAGRYAGT